MIFIFLKDKIKIGDKVSLKSIINGIEYNLEGEILNEQIQSLPSSIVSVLT